MIASAKGRAEDLWDATPRPATHQPSVACACPSPREAPDPLGGLVKGWQGSRRSLVAVDCTGPHSLSRCNHGASRFCLYAAATAIIRAFASRATWRRALRGGRITSSARSRHNSARSSPAPLRLGLHRRCMITTTTGHSIERDVVDMRYPQPS
jgi:hypothetical protein